MAQGATRRGALWDTSVLYRHSRRSVAETHVERFQRLWVAIGMSTLIARGPSGPRIEPNGLDRAIVTMARGGVLSKKHTFLNFLSTFDHLGHPKTSVQGFSNVIKTRHNLKTVPSRHGGPERVELYNA